MFHGRQLHNFSPLELIFPGSGKLLLPLAGNLKLYVTLVGHVFGFGIHILMACHFSFFCFSFLLHHVKLLWKCRLWEYRTRVTLSIWLSCGVRWTLSNDVRMSSKYHKLEQDYQRLVSEVSCLLWLEALTGLIRNICASGVALPPCRGINRSQAVATRTHSFFLSLWTRHWACDRQQLASLCVGFMDLVSETRQSSSQLAQHYFSWLVSGARLLPHNLTS